AGPLGSDGCHVSVAGDRQVWTITGRRGGRESVESDGRGAEESEPAHGEALGEKGQRFGDRRLRLRGRRTRSGSSTLEAWAPFDEGGVVSPGKVLVTRDGQEGGRVDRGPGPAGPQGLTRTRCSPDPAGDQGRRRRPTR